MRTIKIQACDEDGVVFPKHEKCPKCKMNILNGSCGCKVESSVRTIKVSLAANEYRQEKETRTYDITAKPYQLDLFEEFLSMVEYVGGVGASRALQLWIDGDGSAQFKFARQDGTKLRQLEGMGELTDADPVKLRGID